MSDTMKIQENKRTETTPTPKRGFSTGIANSLLIRSGDGSGIHCAFCNGEHYSSACEEVEEIQKRKNILRRDKRCFLCLSVGHRANQCTRVKKCRVCDRTDHHQSVYEMSSNQSRPETPAAPRNAKTKEDREPSASKKPPQNITTTSTARSKVQVLLQTARTLGRNECVTNEPQRTSAWRLLEHMLMLRIVPSYYLFVYYLIAEAKDLTLQII